MKTTVIFDLDGTLTDSGPGIKNAIVYAQKKLNYPELTNAQLCSCIGPPLGLRFMQLWNLSEAEATNAVKIFREYYGPTGIFENTPYDGIRELLDTLCQSGTECWVCSSKPQGALNTVLTHFDLQKYFTHARGAESTENFIGKADRMKQLLDEFKPERAVMCGDRSDDIESAHVNGLFAIGVLWGYGSRAELEAAGADALVSSPRELEQLLK